MKLSELERKDIINIRDGKRIGRIVDVEFDITNGYMIRFIIESSNIIKIHKRTIIYSIYFNLNKLYFYTKWSSVDEGEIFE